MSSRWHIRHPARWIATGVLAVLVVLGVVLATRPSATATQVASPLVGKEAPSFSQTSLEGAPVSLAQYRGRYVYVNFFASWCQPCQAEEPALVDFQFQQSHLPDGAALLSVVYDDPDNAARAYVRQWGVRWPTIPDPGGQIASSYGVTSPPTTYLIDPRGRIVGEWYSSVTVADLDSMLASARKGR